MWRCYFSLPPAPPRLTGSSSWSRDGRLRLGRPLGASPRPLRAGFIHVIAINLAIGSAMLAGDLLPAVAAWPLAALFATLIYLSLIGVEMTLMERGEAA